MAIAYPPRTLIVLNAPLRKRSPPSNGCVQGRQMPSAFSILPTTTFSRSGNSATFSPTTPTAILRPTSPPLSSSHVIDEKVPPGPDDVIAMYDHLPQHQSSTTFLPFCAGQIIHVTERDRSGWWSGELDGRQGWFPCNYVQAEITSPTEEEVHGPPIPKPSTQDTDDSYCPRLMVPLLKAHSLLRNAVRDHHRHLFEPAAANITSCVHSILSSTKTYQHDAPLIQRFAVLSSERKRFLAALETLVFHARNASGGASKGGLVEDTQEREMENMLRLGHQILSNARTFLAVLVICETKFPEEQDNFNIPTTSSTSAGGSPHIGEDEHEKPHSRELNVDHSDSLPDPLSTSLQVMEAFRSTHYHCQSTINAFILHAYSHSRSSLIRSRPFSRSMYDLITEIADTVVRFCIMAEALIQHPELPRNRADRLTSMGGRLCRSTSSLADLVRLLAFPLPPTTSEDAEKNSLIQSANGILLVETNCFSAVIDCLNRPVPQAPSESTNANLGGVSDVRFVYRVNDIDPDDDYKILETEQKVPPKFAILNSLSKNDSDHLQVANTPTQRISISSESNSTKSVNSHLSDQTIYSIASSRTASTDYGWYYTRLALSQETIEQESLGDRHSTTWI